MSNFNSSTSSSVHRGSSEHMRRRSRSRSSSRRSIERVSHSRSRSPLYRSKSPTFPREYRTIKPYYDRSRHNLNDPIRENPIPNEILAVFGLDRNATEKDLYHIYRKYQCKKCKVIFDKLTGKPRGFGFVYFNSVDDAKMAKRYTDRTVLLTRQIRVDYSIGEKDYRISAKGFAPHYYRDSNSTSSSRRPDRYTHVYSEKLSPEAYMDKHYRRYDERDYVRHIPKQPRTPSPVNPVEAIRYSSRSKYTVRVRSRSRSRSRSSQKYRAPSFKAHH